MQQCVSRYKGIKVDGLNPRAETLFILPGILQTLRPVIGERTGNTVYFSYENRNGQRSSINLTNSLTGIAKAIGALHMGMLNKNFRGYRDDIIKAIYLEPSALHIVDSFPRSFVHASFFQLCIDNGSVTKPE